MTSPTRKLEQSTGGLRCAATSDVGMRRTSNQDSMAINLSESPARWASHGHLFVVADGMGAHAAGELASKLATDTISHSYFKRTDRSPSEAIDEAVREANNTIHTKGQNSVDFQGMGTTCSCLLLLPQGALVAHVGDSRVYRLRDNRFEQLTFDHSLVWEMAAASHAAEEDIPAYVPKNVITRSLGPHPTVAVDIEGPFALRSGDRFLLCSDGLTGPLNPELIGMVLSSLPAAEVPQSLVDLANLLGGPDNITAVIVEIANASELGEPVEQKSSKAAETSAAVKRPSIHPLGWIAMAFSALVAVTAVAIGNPLLATLSAGAGIGVGVVSWMLKNSRCRPCESAYNLRGQRGKAPYRCHDCAPSALNISTLGDIVRQLEDLEGQRDWSFDWQSIHEKRHEAHEAISRGDYQAAVAAFCQAVHRLMESLRLSTAERPSDSNVDLA